jgi:hypothetical protein
MWYGYGGFDGGWDPLRALIMYRVFLELTEDRERRRKIKKEGKL